MRALDLGYTARPQFVPFHKRIRYETAKDGGKTISKKGKRFACLVCHRRAGKTVATVLDLIDSALNCPYPRPRYAYVAPFIKQAKAVAWDYARHYALKLQSNQIRVEINEAELRIDFSHNQSRIRLFGADNPDALRGIYLDGVVLDECADIDPRLWPEVIRPALSDRHGWAVFIGTPRGRNQFYTIHTEAMGNPDWYHMVLKASQSGLISEEELASIRKEMTAEQYAQEYECSFDAAVLGAYYAKLMEGARENDRIGNVPYDPSLPVYTAWDLGYRDATAIVFAQMVGKAIHIIDYLEASNQPLGYYVRELRDRPFIYAGHLLPFDAEVVDFPTGKSRTETIRALGLTETRIVPKHERLDGINACRLLIPKCWFDERRCWRLIEALSLYRSEVDHRFIDPETKQPLLKKNPTHDWTSHPADAFRYLAMGLDDKGFAKGFYAPIDYPKRGIV